MNITKLSTLNKSIRNDDFIQMESLNIIKKINLISMNLFILLALPYFLHKPGWKKDI